MISNNVVYWPANIKGVALAQVGLIALHKTKFIRQIDAVARDVAAAVVVPNVFETIFNLFIMLYKGTEN